MKAPLATLLGLFFLLFAGYRCAPYSIPTYPASSQPSKQIWLEPAEGAPDLLALFTNPEQWSSARAKVNVFQFFMAHLLAVKPTDCPLCGAGLWPALQRVGAFDKLAAWNIDAAVKVSLLALANCPTGSTPAGTASLVLGNLQNAMANLLGLNRFLYEATIEGSLIQGPVNCSFSLSQSADAVATFAGQALGLDPALLIGIREAYPFSSVAQIESWTQLLIDRGYKPAFFHLFIDFAPIDLSAAAQAALPADLRALQAYMVTQGIPFGVSFSSGKVVTDNASYYAGALTRVNTLQPIVGLPTHAIIQGAPFDARNNQWIIPSLLPETGTASQLAFLNQALSILH